MLQFVFTSYKVVVAHELILAYENGRLHITAMYSSDYRVNALLHPHLFVNGNISTYGRVLMPTKWSTCLAGDELADYMKYLHGSYRIDPSIIDDLY